MTRKPLTTVLTSLLLSLGLATGLLSATAPHAYASASSTYEKSVITATNAQRTKAGLGKLTFKKCLDRYAEKRARKIASLKKLVHSNLGTILKKCKLREVSENIAYGYPSGQAVTTGWMNSPGHRANIMRSSSRLIGTGAYRDRSGTWWVAEVMGRK